MSDYLTSPIPTGPDDIPTRGSLWGANPIRPALNVKVYGSIRDLTATTFADIGAESNDPIIATMTGKELRDAAMATLESMERRGAYWVEGIARELSWSYAQVIAEELFDSLGYNVEVWSDGRSGGWLVVDGLPDPTDEDNWREGDDEHDRGDWLNIAPVWATFSDRIAELVADFPYQIAWHLIHDADEEVAGRVVDVTLRMVLSDTDMANAGNDPHDWAWRDMLDLDGETTLHVRDNLKMGNAGKFRAS